MDPKIQPTHERRLFKQFDSISEVILSIQSPESDIFLSISLPSKHRENYLSAHRKKGLENFDLGLIWTLKQGINFEK